jgi:hypothetical protein
MTQGKIRIACPTGSNPHFSQGFYYGVTEDHVYYVALLQAPRHTVKYACGAFGRAPVSVGKRSDRSGVSMALCTCLGRFAYTKPCEKCGLKAGTVPDARVFGADRYR